jgi:hypothetical protein
MFCIIDVVDQAKLGCGDFYFVAVRELAKRIFYDSRMIEALFGELFFEAPFDAAIQLCPFFLGIGMDSVSAGTPAGKNPLDELFGKP